MEDRDGDLLIRKGFSNERKLLQHLSPSCRSFCPMLATVAAGNQWWGKARICPARAAGQFERGHAIALSNGCRGTGDRRRATGALSDGDGRGRADSGLTR